MPVTVCDNITLTFHSVPFLRKGQTILRIVISSVSSFYRTKIVFGSTAEKTLVSKRND